MRLGLTRVGFVCAVVAVLCCGVRASAAGAVERFAKFDGMRVRYLDVGKGEEALVFVHGWTCNAEFWRSTCRATGGARGRRAWRIRWTSSRAPSRR
jgi:hypothetical protein